MRQNRFDDLNIGPFIVPADIVDLAHPAIMNYQVIAEQWSST